MSKKGRKLNYRATCTFVIFLCFVFMIFAYFKFRSPFYTTVQIEAGDSLTVEDLLKRNADDAEIVTDISKNVLNKVGEHQLKVKCDTGFTQLTLRLLIQPHQ